MSIIYNNPPMVCLFGVSKDNWNTSLQFKNFKTDHVIKNF